MDYVAFKDHVAALMASPNHDALAHVHGGMAALLLARVISGRSLATPFPLMCVVVLQVINECIDRYFHGSWRVMDTAADTLNTLFWPVVLFVALRLRRQRS